MNSIESILNKYKKGTYEGEYPTVSEEDFIYSRRTLIKIK